MGFIKAIDHRSTEHLTLTYQPGSFIHLKYHFFKRCSLKLHGSRQTRIRKKSWWMSFVFSIWHQSQSCTYFRLPLLHFPYTCIFPWLIRGTNTYFKLQECVIYLELFQNYYQLKIWNSWIHKTQTKHFNFYKKMFIRTLANFRCFQRYKRHLKMSSH